MNIPYISAEEVKDKLSMDEALKCTEEIYIQKSDNKTVVWPTIFYEFDLGHSDMDIKSGYLPQLDIFGHKTVAFMEDNIQKGLPDLVGLIVVFSSITGLPIGLVDGSSVTGMRTGAAAAIGAKYLARKDSKNALILGTGNQAKYQIAALLKVFPSLENIFIANPHNPNKAVLFSDSISETLMNEFLISTPSNLFTPVINLEESVKDSDIIITITPSRVPLIKKEWVRPGTHFSCIGADMAGKEEIDPLLFKNSIIYVDDFEHCISSGEIEIPVKQEFISKDDIEGEIGDLILGKTKGRLNDNDITIYDSTGMALLDLAVANLLLNK